MAAQNGKDLLVKIDMTGGGMFDTAAGLRATRISLLQMWIIPTPPINGIM